MKNIIEPSAQSKEVKPLPEITLPTLEELLQAGSHFGHRTSAWNPKMKPYIYGERNDVHIIDLVKTLKATKVALEVIQKAAAEGYILVVGTKGQAVTMVMQMALQKGAFYINKRWPGGLFTNFKGVKRSIDNLVKMENMLSSGVDDMVKKEQVLMQKEVERFNKVYDGIKFMDKLPSLVVVIDSKVEKNAIREANNMGIPVVALMDTNCDPSVVKYPIPANDDSLKSIALFVELFGKAIEDSKYSKNLIETRTSHVTALIRQKEAYEAEVERTKAMAEAEKERLKAMRQGIGSTAQKTVVRIIEKQVNPLSIAETELPERTKKSLLEAGYESLDQLKGLKKAQLLELKGIGEKAVVDIIKLLK